MSTSLRIIVQENLEDVVTISHLHSNTDHGLTCPYIWKKDDNHIVHTPRSSYWYCTIRLPCPQTANPFFSIHSAFNLFSCTYCTILQNLWGRSGLMQVASTAALYIYLHSPSCNVFLTSVNRSFLPRTTSTALSSLQADH